MQTLNSETGISKTSIRVPTKVWRAIRIKLLAQGRSFQEWVNRKILEELMEDDYGEPENDAPPDGVAS